jgi:ubiquinone/menaquinone biosynthesis C-methylase UbiE
LPVRVYSTFRQAGSLLARSGKLPDFRGRYISLVYSPRGAGYKIIGMWKIMDDFAQFEHAGWQRVADKYDSEWSSLTRQFIPSLLADASVSHGMLALDVACGPGYVSAAAKNLGAVPTGIDFSHKMVAIAKRMFPEIRFTQGDAQDLPFEDGSFDRVFMNFGLLHVSQPEKACAEACRVLKRGGKFGFTVWAGPERNPGAKIVSDAIEAYANLDVGLPEGPPKYLYGEREECRQVLKRGGFDGASMSYETRTVEWHLPDAGYLFEAERDAGVRTAGLLARQSPEKLEKIRIAIEDGIKQYARGNEFILPMTAHVVAVSKN